MSARGGSQGWLWRCLRIVILALAALAAVAVLHWIVQIFICDLRETAFPDMPRRAAWLCP